MFPDRKRGRRRGGPPNIRQQDVRHGDIEAHVPSESRPSSRFCNPSTSAGVVASHETNPAFLAPSRRCDTRTVDPEKVGLKFERKSNPVLPKYGRPIRLKSNCFPVEVPSGYVYHYDVDIIPKNEYRRPEKTVTKKTKDDTRYRCLNTKKNRQIIELVLETNHHFRDLYGAFDGQKNLYTRKELEADFPMECEVVLPDENFGDYDDIQSPRQEVFRVIIKPVRKDGSVSCAINLDSLHALFEKKMTSVPQETVMALETILRHGPCLRFTPVGRSFFYPSHPRNLNGGLEIWQGYHQSVRLGQWGPNVTLNTTATAFWPEGPVLNYIADLLGKDVQQMSRIPYLAEAEIKRISKKLKGKKIKVTHLHYEPKFTIFKLTTESAHTLTFDFDFEANGNTTPVTVFRYFEKRYRIVLSFPNLPCLQVKHGKRKIFYPIEVCKFLHGRHAKTELTAKQKSKMIQFTSVPPKRRFEDIREIVRNKADFNNDKCVREFGLKVSSKPLSCIGRVLDPPNLKYENKEVCPEDGSWNMRGAKFLEGACINRWMLLALTKIDSNCLKKFVDLIVQEGKNLGVRIRDPVKILNSFHEGDNYNVEKLLLNAREIVELAIIVLPTEKEADVYGEIKRCSEILFGFTTQCIRGNTVRNLDDRRGPQIIRNLWLKINAKMGGRNSCIVYNENPSILEKPVIIIGADVNHPAPSSSDEKKPSLAACVGSLDRYLFRYAVTIRPQVNTDEKKQIVEIIGDLEEMVKELLTEFYVRTQRRPEKIIFYRDGVSEGQFEKVRTHEVMCVRKACRSLQDSYEPGITFIVAQKRHHTRFMPEDSRDGVGNMRNIPPGTVIDNVVTHPVNSDFFLCSHFGLKGTSRPCHYTVLEDDNNFTVDDLQKLTYQLCHLYVRCTKSISIPAPVAYADLAAYRARRHLEAAKKSETDFDSSCSSLSSSDDLTEEIFNSVKIIDTLKSSMYFV